MSMFFAASHGLMITETEKCVYLVDLDGTLLHGNSFHKWLKYIMWRRYSGVTSVCRLTTAFLCMLRAIRLIDHAHLKRGVQKSWGRQWIERLSPGFLAGPFVEILCADVRLQLLSEVQQLMNHAQAVVVLTTAAPAEYAYPLGAALGFRHIVATPYGHSADWYHNLREAKRDHTIAYLRQIGITASCPMVLFTDHIDDTPLIKLSTQTFWYGTLSSCPSYANIFVA